MKLKLIPCQTNKYNIGGLLIKGSELSFWISELETMKFNFQDIQLYPVPGQVPNQVVACAVLFKNPPQDFRSHQKLQCVHYKLFIPEFSDIFPGITATELSLLLKNDNYLFHPEIGFFALKEALNLTQLLIFQINTNQKYQIPAEPLFIPKQIQSFQVIPFEDEVLERLEKKLAIKKEKMPDEPLSSIENFKREFGKFIFTKPSDNQKQIEKNGFSKFLDNVGAFFGLNKGKQVTDDIIENIEDLEKRNQSHLEKLLEMFEKNIDEALKYAIPIDGLGTRGAENLAFNLSKRWGDFSLFGSQTSGHGGGSVSFSDDSTNKLREQYRKAAEELVKNKEFEKAAFIYLKLLHDYHHAAHILEQGELYAEAAAIYMKYCKNSTKAAECYEKAKMYAEAIKLYEDLKKYEKVADLYLKINKKQEAMKYYEMVVDQYLTNKQYLQAANLLLTKMEKFDRAQDVLLQGWKENYSACLQKYFENISDEDLLEAEISKLYLEIENNKKTMYLKIIKPYYSKNKSLQLSIRNMAYEIISEQVHFENNLVDEIRYFEQDNELSKDVMRYKMNKKYVVKKKK